MINNDYEYRDLMAATWDLFRGDTSKWEDKFYYEKMIRQYGQPVLDVGCGTGRLLLDFLAQGIDVDGIDISPEMLAICRENAEVLNLNPALYQQGMEELDLPRKYCTIIVPSLSFQLVVDAVLAAQAIERFYEHLEIGGVLIIPVRIFWEEGDPEELDWKMLAEMTRPEDGAILRHWAHATFDGENQLQHTQDRYEIWVDDELVESEYHERSPALRWYTQNQMLSLFRAAKFEDIRVLRGFEDKPASEEDTLYTMIGIK